MIYNLLGKMVPKPKLYNMYTHTYTHIYIIAWLTGLIAKLGNFKTTAKIILGADWVDLVICTKGVRVCCVWKSLGK